MRTVSPPWETVRPFRDPPMSYQLVYGTVRASLRLAIHSELPPCHRLACHAASAARSSSAVRPVTVPPELRAQDNVSRAVCDSGRTVKPAARAGDVSRVLKPAYSGSGSHIGSERGPAQRRMFWLSRNARSTQVNEQEAPM